MTLEFVKISIMNFLVYFVFYILVSTIAPYASFVLKESTAISGLASGIFVIGILFGRLYAGSKAIGTSPRKIVIYGAFLFFLLSIFYPFANKATSLIVVRFLHGVSFGIVHNAGGTIAARILPASKRGEGIAYYTLGQIIAAALGPFIGMEFLRKNNFGMLFSVAIIVSFFSLVLSFMISDQKKYEVKNTKSDKDSSKYIEFTAIPVSSLIMITGLSYSSVLAFISMYGTSIKLDRIAGYFFIFYAITVFTTRPISGRLLDMWGAEKVLYPCILFFSVGMFLLADTRSGVSLVISAVFIGLGYGNILSLGQAEAVKKVSDKRIGLAISTYYIFLDIGAGIGPYVAGALIPYLGYRNLYLLMSLVVALTVPIYWVLKRCITQIRFVF